MLSQQDAELLEASLANNPKIETILRRAPELGMKNWYLGAGCISQTVWNELHGFPPESHIKDYDLVYYESSDLSMGAEDSYIERADPLFKDLGIKVDIKNEARVHLWYKERFGNSIKPYDSAEDAISKWPTTATSVGVTNERGKFEAFAPFGLSDMFALIVRPNKKQVTKDIYMEKATRWKSTWPKLRVVLWDDA